jgi:hypothetical protein
MQKHRIHTDIGQDRKINVEIKQDYDLMEILSLKFSQKDIYSSGNCSAYGVVVGRVSANNGFGVPNAKVSIFIPQSDLDIDDPVISALYPYRETGDRDQNNYRYNLLPARQQHAGHTPTGTFFDQEDILTREECLQVFETYYKYTVKTNTAGDFMIWGVPIGNQRIHVDLDLSDIGCFSLRPYDFIKKGVGPDHFERFYKFKASSDLDGLPQIVTFDKGIIVYPLWGSADLCEIGITRTDFDLTDKGIVIEPISLILVSTITDDNTDAVKRNGHIRPHTGYKCNLQTTGGKIECVRQTGNKVLSKDGTKKYPELEFYNIIEVIDEDGVAMAVLPMNMEYVYTNIFGEEEITNDKNKGIPTTTIARLRLGLNYDSRKVSVAKYLVPNIREFNPYSDGGNNKLEYYESMLSSYQFSDVFEDYITVDHPTGVTISSIGYDATVKQQKEDLLLGTNNNGIPEDYFYKFIYGKVYTVSSFQGTHYETDRRDAFLGIKQIRPTADEDCASKTNYFPTNFGFKNRIKFSLIISEVLLFFHYLFAGILIRFAEIIGKFFYDLHQMFYGIGIRRWRPFRKISERFENASYNMQDRFTKTLPLTIYPDCEECTNDDTAQIIDASMLNDYCRVAEVGFMLRRDDSKRYLYVAIEYSLLSDPIWFRNQTTQISFFSDTGDTKNYIFPNEYAKDGEGLCSGSTPFYYYQLTGMTNQTIPPVPPSTLTENFIGAVYAYDADPGRTGATFSDFICLFNNETGEPSNVKIIRSSPYGRDSLVLSSNNNLNYFTYDEWNELTGMDLDSLSPKGLEASTLAILRIYDRSLMKTTGETPQDFALNTGCQKYDKTYNESIVFGYLWSSGNTYDPITQPMSPDGLPETDANIHSYTGDTGYEAWGFREYLPATTLPPPPYGAYLVSTLIGASNTKRLPYKKVYIKIPDDTYDRKTKSGLSEFRNGIFTLIPVIKGKSNNLKALQEWYRRKRVGLAFCGGVVNYSFIDNWLNGILYFFKFDKRLRWDNETVLDLNQRGSKFPRQLVFYHILDKLFYYRSCPFYGNSFVGQSYEGMQEILHPTTFYDVGVRDEFLGEICLDPRVDPYCSVVRDITSTSYQDPAYVVEYAINYRLDIKGGKFDVDDFFTKTEMGSNIKVFDGDITQLMSINCEAGIEGFDLDAPHYFMFDGDVMDPETPAYASYFKGGTANFGPVPIDFKMDNNGVFVRSCLNYRLGDYTQKVPFYLWEKGYPGFGPYNDATSDQQAWDKTQIASMPLQRLFSISGITDTKSNYLMSDGEEEYLLKPMTINHEDFWFYGAHEDSLERFEVISYGIPPTFPGSAQPLYAEGDLWLYVLSGSLRDPQSGILYAVVNSTWTPQPAQNYFDGVYETFVPQTILNYWGSKQVLSTPFQFYFGLKPEKTALDVLIKYFGPKGAFPTESTPCPNYGIMPTPSATPAASLLPIPSRPSTSNPWASPSPTPSVTPSPIPPLFSLDNTSMSWEYADTYVWQESDLNGYGIDKWCLNSLPVWLTLQVYQAGSWNGKSIGNCMYVTDGDYRIRIAPHNTADSFRSGTITFYNDNGVFTGATSSIDVSQNAPPLGVTYVWNNYTGHSPLTPTSNEGGMSAGSTAYHLQFTVGSPIDGWIYDTPWSITRGGSILASGTITTIHLGYPTGAGPGILNSAIQDGDLININIGPVP